MLEDLRGVFFILKGSYRHHLEPAWVNPVTETTNWCGGFNPSLSTTEEWYMLLDSLTLTCHRASSDLQRVLEGVDYTIKKYKTRAVFEKTMRSLEFGMTSKSTKALDEHLGHLYGHHFAALVREREDIAYTHLRENTPVAKARKLKRRVVTPVSVSGAEDTPPTTKTTPVAVVPKRKKFVPKKRTPMTV